MSAPKHAKVTKRQSIQQTNNNLQKQKMQVRSQNKVNKNQLNTIFNFDHTKLSHQSSSQQSQPYQYFSQQVDEILKQIQQVKDLRTLEKICVPSTHEEKSRVLLKYKKTVDQLSQRLEEVHEMIKQFKRGEGKSSKAMIMTLKQGKSSQDYQNKKQQIRQHTKEKKEKIEQIIQFVYYRGKSLFQIIQDKLQIIFQAFDMKIHLQGSIKWEIWRQSCLDELWQVSKKKTHKDIGCRGGCC